MNQVRVLCFAIVVLAVCHVEANPMKRQDAADYQNCKNICGLCDCVGFFCGDECICECHNKTDGSEWNSDRSKQLKCIFRLFFHRFRNLDVNCIDDMQNNCEKSGAQFEVLIQGPSGSRFVRSLVLADADAHKEPIDPTHVSTISVFQPNGHKKLVKRDIEADVAEALADSGANI